MNAAPLLRTVVASVVSLCLIALAAAASAQARGVFVNGVALESAYRTRLVPGRYWYDRASGLWGLQGGPSVGVIAPGLSLGGALDSRASVGRYAGITGVFVNGREIHPDELQYLRALYGNVVRARYWLDQSGMAGYEGGPPQFNLAAARQSRQGGSTLHRGLFGSSGSDGSCSYYMHPNGSSVMTGNC